MRHRTGQFYGHYATDALCCETAKSYLRVEPQYLDPKRFQSRLRLTTNLQAFDGVCATVYRSHTSEDVIHILHGPSKIGQSHNGVYMPPASLVAFFSGTSCTNQLHLPMQSLGRRVHGQIRHHAPVPCP